MNGLRAVSYDRGTSAVIAGDQKNWLQLLGEVGQALAQGDPAAQRYLLLLRFLLANVVALARVGAAAGQGWIGMILKADTGRYSLAIVAVFAVGFVWSPARAAGQPRAQPDQAAPGVSARGDAGVSAPE
jgi:hypothetical protein